jgi:hypothetical protein
MSGQLHTLAWKTMKPKSHNVKYKVHLKDIYFIEIKANRDKHCTNTSRWETNDALQV